MLIMVQVNRGKRKHNKAPTALFDAQCKIEWDEIVKKEPFVAFDESDSDSAQITYQCSECYAEFEELKEVRCHQKTCSQTWVHEAVETREDLILPPAIKLESNELNDGQNLPSNCIRDESNLMQNSVSKSGIENETVNVNLKDNLRKTTAGNHKEPSKVVNKAINYNHKNVTILYRKLSDKLNSYLSKGSKTTESSQPADRIDPYEFVDDEVDQSVSHNPKLYRRNVGKKPKSLTTKPYFAASPKRHKKTHPLRKLGHKTDKTRLMSIEKLVGYTSESVRNPTNTLFPVNPITPSNGKDSTPTVESGKLMTLKEYRIALKACLEESYSELKANRGVTVTHPEKTVRRTKSRSMSKETVETEQSIGINLTSGTSRGHEVVKVLNKEPEKPEPLIVKRDVDLSNSDTVRKKRLEAQVVSNSVDSGTAVTSKVDCSEQPESVLIANKGLDVSKPESMIIKRRKSRCKSKDSMKQSVGISLTSQKNHEVVVKNSIGRTRRKRSGCKRADRDAKTEIKTVQLKEPDMVRNNQPELNNIFMKEGKHVDDRTIKRRKAKISKVDVLDKEVIIKQQVTTDRVVNEVTSEDTNDLNKTNTWQVPSDTINVSKASTDNDLCKLVNNPVKYLRCSSDTGGSLMDQKADKHLTVKLPNIRQFSSRSSLKLVDNMKEQCPELEKKLDNKKLAVVIKLERLNYKKLKKSTLKRKIAKSRKGNAD